MHAGEDQVAGEAAHHPAQGGHPQQCDQGHCGAGILGVDPQHRGRSQQGPEVEADPETPEREHLDDRPQPQPLDRGQDHDDQDDEVHDVHEGVRKRALDSARSGAERTNTTDVR